MHNCVLVGDKGYLSRQYQDDVFDTAAIWLETPIRRNYAKSFQGLATQILSKLTALALIQWLNQRNDNKLNNLKIVIS